MIPVQRFNAEYSACGICQRELSSFERLETVCGNIFCRECFIEASFRFAELPPETRRTLQGRAILRLVPSQSAQIYRILETAGVFFPAEAAHSPDPGWAQITNLPDAIGPLSQLSSLSLRNDQLTSLPDAIGNRQQQPLPTNAADDLD